VLILLMIDLDAPRSSD